MNPPWYKAWLNWTDHEYYNRIRQIMIESGMGEGDVEMILANCFEIGWIAGKNSTEENDD